MEQDWNNNGVAIDAMLRDMGLTPALPRDESPVATGPFVDVLDGRLVALEQRVTTLEATTKKETTDDED